MGRSSVLLTTEGTYPYHPGGVGTWCQTLTSDLSEVDFTVLAVTTHPAAPQYRFPRNVRGLITVPVWGTEDPAEYGRHHSFPDYLRRRWSLATRDVQEDYLPHYEQFLREVTNPTGPPRVLGLALLQMHLHLRYYDYHRTQAHPAVWDTFVSVMQRGWRDAYPGEAAPSVAELADAWRLHHRLMVPLALNLPTVDVTHATAAGFCGLPCLMAKLCHRTPYLLTEHRAYVSEQYLNLGGAVESLFVRWFLSRLVSSIVDVNYAYADQVAPSCKHTMRWEQWRDVETSRIRVIYNGVDPEKFHPAPRADHTGLRVVNLGQISPLKGQLDLIQAAALVRRDVPDVAFRFYGAPADEGYYRQCRDLVRALSLEDIVVFAGADADPAEALREADVVALASISEAFPHAVVEAMLSEAAIVATDVGGVHEAIGDTGLLVKPRDPVGMAEAITTLLLSPDSCRRLGRDARERACRWFSRERFADAYRSTYKRLVAPVVTRAPEVIHTFALEADRESAIA